MFDIQKEQRQSECQPEIRERARYFIFFVEVAVALCESE
jgi:hypothetical protein